MIFAGYLEWVAYWAINSIAVRTVQSVFPDSLVGQTLAAMQ